MVVHIQVAAALGEQLVDPLDFLFVLTDMRLHVQVRVFAQQLPGQRQLLRRAGGGEAWRHRIVQAAFAVPAFDQRLALLVAGFGGVGQVVWSVAVHHHLAGDHAQVEFFGGLEECLHRLRMHAAEHQRSGGAVAQQFLDENLRDVLGMGLVGELALAGEGVGVEPVQQLFAISADHAGLRQVDMRVDQAWGDQRVLIMGDFDLGGQARQQVMGVAQGADPAVVDDQQAVFEILVGRLDPHFSGVGEAVQDSGTVGFAGRRHGDLNSWQKWQLDCGARPAAVGQSVRHSRCAGRNGRCRWR